MAPAGDAAPRRVLVTGASRGLGGALAAALAAEGRGVIAACRNPVKAEAAASALMSDSAEGRAAFGRMRFAALDLASFASVRAFASALLGEGRPLDTIVNNAGIAHGLGASGADGFELAMQTNFLSHFLLGGLLEPLLRMSEKPAVVNLTSSIQMLSGWNALAGRMGPDAAARPASAGLAGGIGYYAASKFAMSAFALGLAERGAAWGLRIVALHPGVVDTGIMYRGGRLDWAIRAVTRPFVVDIGTGAGRLRRAVAVAEEGNRSGGAAAAGTAGFVYLKGEKPAVLPAALYDRARRDSFWESAEDAVRR